MQRHVIILLMSLPARGVWIEIQPRRTGPYVHAGHSPQGECGLKYRPGRQADGANESLPARGVWIEIVGRPPGLQSDWSLPARGVWIEIPRSPRKANCRASHSPQGECGLKYQTGIRNPTASSHSPQGECGLKYIGRPVFRDRPTVTPRKGSVD